MTFWEEMHDSSIDDRWDYHTHLVQRVVWGNNPVARPCKICEISTHVTDDCPRLNDEFEGHANAVENFQRQRRNYDPSLSGLVKTLASHTIELQKNFDLRFANLETQMSQIVSAVSCIVNERSGNLPAQPEANPKKGEEESKNEEEKMEGKSFEHSVSAETHLNLGRDPPCELKQSFDKQISAEMHTNLGRDIRFEGFDQQHPPLPFPHLIEAGPKKNIDEKLMEIFRQVEVSIPLFLLDHFALVERPFCKEGRKPKERMRGRNFRELLRRLRGKRRATRWRFAQGGTYAGKDPHFYFEPP